MEESGPLGWAGDAGARGEHRPPTPGTDLPVRALDARLRRCLRTSTRLVLTAPTGSGKTTQVPQMLLASGLVHGQIVCLQPRRLAVRLVARRVADEMGVRLGDVVGYQTRHDSRISATTRIRFLTDGLFLRLCRADPQLRDLGAVIIDEFHERSVAADVALGWVRRLQRSTRPRLLLLVMSATLDAEGLATRLGCPLLRAEGRRFPVAVGYAGEGGRAPVWERAAQALGEVLSRAPDGDVLIFMPGPYEIRRTLERAQQLLANGRDTPRLLPLHGSLSAARQDEAVAASARRKVIIATNVAETSITIPGVHHVIDSGLARVHRHDPRRGIDALLIESVSRAATEQRAGRAGRTAPGTCTRLWSAAEQARRPEHDVPEIQRLDLAATVLLLAALGVSDPLSFPWLDPPEVESLERARQQLVGLGALTDSGALTATGSRLSELPMDPRLGRMLLEAQARDCVSRGLLWAALLSERDLLSSDARNRYRQAPDAAFPSDLSLREQLFQRARQAHFAAAACAELGVRGEICRQVQRTRALYARALGGDGAGGRRGGGRPGATDRQGKSRGHGSGGTDAALIQCLLVGFFDRVAVRRQEGTLRFAMADQRRVELDAHSVARESRAVVALEARELDVGRHGVRTVLSLASAIDVNWLEQIHPQRVETRSTVSWNEADGAVEQHEEWVYDGLVFLRERAPRVDPAAAEALLVTRIRRGELKLARWDGEVEQWILRVRLLARLLPERGLITYSDEDVAVILHELVAGATRASHLRQRPCLDYVRQALSYADQQFVEQMAPTRLRLPGGTRMRITYASEGAPRARARIQELYDLHQTPTIAAGRQPLLLEILGPNQRPVQVTDDLASFWRSTYPELKKELKRRYPKHEWR